VGLSPARHGEGHDRRPRLRRDPGSDIGLPVATWRLIAGHAADTERPGMIPGPFHFHSLVAFAGQAGGQASGGEARSRKNSPESGPWVSGANSMERPLGENTAPSSVPLASTSAPSLCLGPQPPLPSLKDS